MVIASDCIVEAVLAGGVGEVQTERGDLRPEKGEGREVSGFAKLVRNVEVVLRFQGLEKFLIVCCRSNLMFCQQGL